MGRSASSKSRPALPSVAEDPIGPGGPCGWCERPYVWAEGAWWCLTEACQAAQASCAVSVRDDKTGAIRWLYVPTSHGVDYELCPAKNRMIGGAAGGSKSHDLRWGMLRKAATIPGYEGLILRRTYGELERSQLRRLAMDVPMLGGVYYPSSYMVEFQHPNGPRSLIEAGHLDDEVALSRWLSTEYDEISADEGSTFNPKHLLELSTRARTSKPAVKRAGGARFNVGTNPGGPAWPVLKDLFVNKTPDYEQFPALKKYYKPEKWVYQKRLLTDNPYRDEDYEESLAVLGEARYRQLRWGDENVFEGQFFSEWRENDLEGNPYHVQVIDVPPGTEGFCSLDWGFNDPFVCYWWVCLPDGRYYIRREWKDSGIWADDFAKEWWRITRDEVGWTRARYVVVGGDTRTHHGLRTPHGETVDETLRHFGLPVRAADQSRKPGWYRVHELLRPTGWGSPWLVFHPSCTYARRTLPNAPSDPLDLDEIDEKAFPQVHGLESIRYGAMSRPSPTRIHKSTEPGPGTWGFETKWQEQQMRRQTQVIA